MARYNHIGEVKIGDKVILDNTLGIVSNVEKVKLLAEVLEVIDDIKVKVKVESSIYLDPVETICEYYLFR